MSNTLYFLSASAKLLSIHIFAKDKKCVTGLKKGQCVPLMPVMVTLLACFNLNFMIKVVFVSLIYIHKGAFSALSSHWVLSPTHYFNIIVCMCLFGRVCSVGLQELIIGPLCSFYSLV